MLVTYKHNYNLNKEKIYILQTLAPNVNDALIELLLTLDSLKRKYTNDIVAIIPYLGYSRQDRTLAPNSSIGFKLIADLLCNAGISKIITFDLHSLPTIGFFNIPIINICTSSKIIKHIKINANLDNVVIVSPDLGGVSRARLIANKLKKKLVIAYKTHHENNVFVEVLQSVEDKNCIIIDDIIDSAKTIIATTYELLEKGATSVIAYCTHNLIDSIAYNIIRNSPLKRLYVANTIHNSYTSDCLENIDIYPLLKKILN